MATSRHGDSRRPFCYARMMFFDSAAWPPPPDGHEPRPPVPRLTPTAERLVMRTVALVLVTMVLGPLAGSSVIEGVIALFR